MKQSIAIVCKTYSGDYIRFDKLLTSIKMYNRDGIHTYVSVPAKDFKLFSKYNSNTVTVLKDETYAGKYFANKQYWGLPLGYINQEICKLAFWENKLAKNYLFVDSDALFIREFGVDDFMLNNSTPYSVLVMDKDLNMQTFYRDYGKSRREHIKNVFKIVGLKDSRLLTCHGMTVMNTLVLEDFKKAFMDKNKFSYEDLIRISPYEYTWYNAWLQKSNIVKVAAVEPFFKTYHMRIEYTIDRIKLIKKEYIKEEYVGIVLNSNWQKRKPPYSYEEPNKTYRLLNKIISSL